MRQTIVVVDAFTARPFAGNPAAVCVLERPAEAWWMQAVAREMNLSETAFLHVAVAAAGARAAEDRAAAGRTTGDRTDTYELRWFTPAVEVELCGHATLAAAHVLWESGRLAADRAACFETRSGRLRAARRDGRIELDFPAEPATALAGGSRSQAVVAALQAALRSAPVWVGRNRFDLLVELESEAAVRSVRPDLTALGALDVRGVMVTARGTPPVDFVSRFFGPAVGVPEDPVTGSAHCCLGPYWAERLGRSELRGYQASARGGHVGVRVRGDRVTLIGDAVTVLEAELVASPQRRAAAAAGE